MKRAILACAVLAIGLATLAEVSAAGKPGQDPAAPAGRGRGRGQAPAGDPAPGGGGGRGGRSGGAPPAAPVDPNAPPDLAGIWNGGGGARPVNSETVPWGKANFPELTERGLAYQKVFDEALSPKYDCMPSTSPAIQYDPYYMQLIQWPDRVIFRYEKDDQVRTVWLDDRKPTVHDISIQGFSTGHYEKGALLVETDHFVFDIAGFDDYDGIPSSQQKKVTERYWKEGAELRVTVTVEDPMFLKKPASYTTRWLAARPGYQLSAWKCDPEASRAAVKMMVPKYK